MKTSICRKVFAASMLLGVYVGTPAYAEYNLVLPDPETSAALYGDFYSYSGPILAAQFPDGLGSSRCGYGSGVCKDFDYDQTIAGKVDEELNVVSSSGGQEITNQPDGTEQAFDGPGGKGGGDPTPFFSTTEIDRNPDNQPGLLADDMAAWDVNLQVFVDAYTQEGSSELSDAILVFNNNEQKDQESETLEAWFQVFIWATDPVVDPTTGEAITLEPIVFTFQDHCPPGSVCLNGGVLSYTEGGILVAPGGADKDPTLFYADKADGEYPVTSPDGNYPAKDDFALSGGRVCFSGNIVDPGSIPIDCADATSSDTEINHNLGSDRISYMLWSPELNDFMQAWANDATSWSQSDGEGGTITYDNLQAYNMLSVDMRLGCYQSSTGTADPLCGEDEEVDNGKERSFWAVGYLEGDTPPPGVPAPSVLALFGIGLMSLFSIHRRRSVPH